MVYLGSYMPVYAFLNLSTATFGGKLAASPPLALCLRPHREVLFTLEGAGVGVSASIWRAPPTASSRSTRAWA